MLQNSFDFKKFEKSGRLVRIMWILIFVCIFLGIAAFIGALLFKKIADFCFVLLTFCFLFCFILGIVNSLLTKRLKKIFYRDFFNYYNLNFVYSRKAQIIKELMAFYKNILWNVPVLHDSFIFDNTVIADMVINKIDLKRYEYYRYEPEYFTVIFKVLDKNYSQIVLFFDKQNVDKKEIFKILDIRKFKKYQIDKKIKIYYDDTFFLDAILNKLESFFVKNFENSAFLVLKETYLLMGFKNPTYLFDIDFVKKVNLQTLESLYNNFQRIFKILDEFENLLNCN